MPGKANFALFNSADENGSKEVLAQGASLRNHAYMCIFIDTHPLANVWPMLCCDWFRIRRRAEGDFTPALVSYPGRTRRSWQCICHNPLPYRVITVLGPGAALAAVSIRGRIPAKTLYFKFRSTPFTVNLKMYIAFAGLFRQAFSHKARKITPNRQIHYQ